MNANRLERANHKWWTLAAMCFALFMIMLDNTVVNVALPSIQRDLNTTPENLEWTINAYFLSFAALILLGGKLGDRFGRKKIFLVGLAIFTLSSAACALSTTDTPADRRARRAGRRRGAHEPALALDHRGRVPAQPGADRDRHLGRHLGPRAGRRAVARRLPRRARRAGRPSSGSTCRSACWPRSRRSGRCSESRDPKARGFDVVGTILDHRRPVLTRLGADPDELAQLDLGADDRLPGRRGRRAARRLRRSGRTARPIR